MKHICVVGTGYVGLVTGTCFADLGNQVICLDINAQKIAQLNEFAFHNTGTLPIYEPGLGELAERNAQAGRLSFTTDYAAAIKQAEFIFLAVDTPTIGNGEGADLSRLESAARSIAQHLDHFAVIINKSTVPVGSGDLVSRIIKETLRSEIDFAVVSNPEFLREGSAVSDFLNPDRVVLGSTNSAAAELVATLYLPLKAPMIVTDIYTAEMIKYASNAFLATKISFINEIAQICERLGADVKEVATGMGYDKRIGRAFLDAGLGYGGSCFPKDVRALAHMAAESGGHPQMLRTVMEINRNMRKSVVDKLLAVLGGLRGCTIGILGLSFKPNTDDMREAASVDIVKMLQAQGANVRVYDPVALKTAQQLITQVTYCTDSYDVAKNCNGLIIVTEWNEFKHLNMSKIKDLMEQPVLIDGRNIYDPQEMKRLGFIYRGVGRSEHRFEARIPKTSGQDARDEDNLLTQKSESVVVS